jgi:hypothetical protein
MGDIASSSADRITSGTTNVYARADGSISFTTVGVTTGYFYNGQLVANGVSLTGNLLARNISASSNVSVTGNVSANQFIGDGSLLTNISASSINGLASDRISSTNNQAGVFARSEGTVSFTLGGVDGAAYLHPSLGLVVTRVSTNEVSGSVVQSTKLVIGNQGTNNAGTIEFPTGDISLGYPGTPGALGWQIFARSVSNSIPAALGDFGFAYFDGTTWTPTFSVDSVTKGTTIGVNVNSAAVPTSATVTLYASTTSIINPLLALRSGNRVYGWYVSGSTLRLNGTHSGMATWVTPSHFILSQTANNASVAINLTEPASTTLHISGTLRIGYGGEACDADRTGAIRYTAGALSFCNGTIWTSLASAGSADWYGITNIPTQVQAVSNSTQITMQRISSTYISASVVQMMGATDGCTTSLLGSVRRDPATGALQLCR